MDTAELNAKSMELHHQAITRDRDQLREKLTFIRRALAAFEKADYYEIFWNVEGEDIRFYALCNDTFWWATADAEQITPGNVDVLESVINDLRACASESDRVPEVYMADLFAARVRKMRPQRPFYKKLSPSVAKLFDECGPARTNDG